MTNPAPDERREAVAELRDQFDAILRYRMGDNPLPEDTLVQDAPYYHMGRIRALAAFGKAKADAILEALSPGEGGGDKPHWSEVEPEAEAAIWREHDMRAVADALRKRADEHADLALEGGKHARRRESAEAAFTQAAQMVEAALSRPEGSGLKAGDVEWLEGLRSSTAAPNLFGRDYPEAQARIDRILSALHPVEAGEGMVLVPVEPTPQALLNIAHALPNAPFFLSPEEAAKVYRAMLAVAPPSPGEGE